MTQLFSIFHPSVFRQHTKTPVFLFHFNNLLTPTPMHTLDFVQNLNHHKQNHKLHFYFSDPSLLLPAFKLLRLLNFSYQDDPVSKHFNLPLSNMYNRLSLLIFLYTCACNWIIWNNSKMCLFVSGYWRKWPSLYPIKLFTNTADVFYFYPQAFCLFYNDGYNHIALYILLKFFLMTEYLFFSILSQP